ncbi:MAG: sugar transferase [Caldilineaceae bacterium]|nr:sugar transferase [Caldilineaceae bacterium]
MTSPSALLGSVIVPVYNGQTSITTCLDALSRQSIPLQHFEVIVVDDGSTDGSRAAVEGWLATKAIAHWQVMSQANAGPAAARNQGAQLAQSPLLLFTDADCAPSPDWVEALLRVFEQPDIVGAKGTYLTDQTGLTPCFVQAEYEDRYDRMVGSERIDFVDTYSAAYRRAIFLENGGFATVFTTASVEDQEFSFRLAAKGYRLVFAPQAQVKHIHDENLGEYFRRKYFIGFWKSLLTRWHPERMVQDSHTPPVLKVQMLLWAALVGLLPWALLSFVWPLLTPIWWLMGGLLAFFLLSALPFAQKLAQHSWKLVLISPLLLAARSLALGLGYLIGTVHFAGTPPGAPRPVIPGWKRLIKRSIDIAGALVGLALGIPLILLAAIAIKVDSDGPIFYLQTRVGEHGRRFRIAKLRSMRVDAEKRLAEYVDVTSLAEPAYKIVDDPRITRVGKFLRRSSLDEWPQFWNVLRGEMSLVGPRPEEEQIVALYNDFQRQRLLIKPGLTGPMQVNGRGDLSLSRRIALELEYIEQYSLWRDIQILAQTVPAVLAGRGAR